MDSKATDRERVPEPRWGGPSGWLLPMAGVLAVVGLALPPATTVEALRPGGADAGLGLVAGAWALKGLLLLHAAVLAWLARKTVPAGGVALVRLPEPEANAGPGFLPAAMGLVVVAIFVRIPGLDAGLWYDEIDTLVSYVRLPLGEILTTFDSKNQHMLFSVLARGAVVLFGESAWTLRAPAMLFGVASVGALLWFGRLVAGRWEALAAAGIMAVSYHHVWFSQNARGYTGLLLWTLLGTGLLLRMLADRRPRSWGRPLAYGGVMALAMFTHATAVFVIGAHALLVAALAFGRRADPRSPTVALPLLGLVLSGTLSLLLYAVVFPQFVDTMLAPTMAGAQTEWKSPVWLVVESLRGLQRGLPGGWVAVLGGAVIGGAGFLGYWRQSKVATAAMLLPLLLTATAIVALQHNLWPRFFFFGAGFALLIVVRGVFVASRLALPRSAAAPVALGVAAALALGNGAILPRAWGPKQDYQGALELVEGSRQPGDAVVMLDMTRLPYAEYLHTDWVAAEALPELRAIEERSSRTWIVYTFPVRLSAVHPEIWTRLQSDYRTVATLPATVGSGEIVVMVKG